MKKLLIILGIVVIFAGLAGVGYWYWQNQVPEMQKVALDNTNVKSFDDVCKKDSKGVLSCEGNISSFNCVRYNKVTFGGADIQAPYPMLACEMSVGEKGVYTQAGELYTRNPTPIGYIIIKDNDFQLIKTLDQFRSLFQPIDSLAKAKFYVEALNKGNVVTAGNLPDKLKDSSNTLPTEGLNTQGYVENANGYYLATIYNSISTCSVSSQGYIFFVQKDGELVEEKNVLINSTQHCIE